MILAFAADLYLPEFLLKTHFDLDRKLPWYQKVKGRTWYKKLLTQNQDINKETQLESIVV